MDRIDKSPSKQKRGRGQQVAMHRAMQQKGMRETRALVDHLTPIDLKVAGIDLGSRSHYVAAADGCDHVIVREYGCFTPDLMAMAEWLKGRGVDQVVMESTGVYWVPVYQVLEDSGLKVVLVDARYSKNLPGRKKTDVYDCSWLRKRQSYGMLRACFVPEKNIAEMRAYWRHRGMLVEQASRQILLMHKALEQMNLQIHKVLSDVSGVTGMAIIRKILDGERDPLVLARLRHPRVKSSQETLVKALTGNYRPEHLFALKQAVDAYDFIHRQMEECDAKLQACMAEFEPEQRANKNSDKAGAEDDENSDKAGAEDDENSDKPGPENNQIHDRADKKARAKRIRRGKNQPRFDLREEQIRITGVDLTKIDGINVMTVQTIITECGPRLSAFETEGRFASFLGLCPNNRITGGKVRSSSTNKVHHRAAQALRQAAESLHHSDSALGGYYRRMCARLGAPVAITAAAHKLARLIFRMIKHGEDYVDRGQQWYEQRYQRGLRERLAKQATRLGLALLEPTTGELVS
jgi:transposase